jgi:hypothetical protein
VAEDFGQEFDRDTATQLCVGSLIDVAHAARTETTRDFVVCEFGSDHGVHEFRLRILSNYPHVIQPFDTYDRNEMKMNLSGRYRIGIGRYRRRSCQSNVKTPACNPAQVTADRNRSG